MKMSRARLVGMLEERLQKNRKLVVFFSPDDIRKQGSWWYVPVWPKNDRMKDRFRYYDVLASVEIDLRDQEKVNVTLVPVSPPDKKEDA